MKPYPFKVWSFVLFGLQSILSACGATRTLCGHRSIHRSVGRATIRLNCKQVSFREHDWPRTAHRKPSDSSSSKGQEQTPQQLHDESPINPPQPKALNLTEEARMQVAGVAFIASHTFQTTKTTRRTPFPSHPSSLLHFSWFQRRSAGREKALGSNSLLLMGTFAWGRDGFLFMGQHSVAIKALIKTVFWS